MMAGATPRPLVAGNWKMNGLAASAAELGKIIAGSAGLNVRSDGLSAGDPARALCSGGHWLSRGDRRPGLPSASLRAPTPATSPQRCWRMPVRAR